MPGVPINRKVLSPIIISSCLPSCSLCSWCRGSWEIASSCLRYLLVSPFLEVWNGMVVPVVPGTHKFLSPIRISSCLPSCSLCSLGAGWWRRGSWEIASACLPSYSPRVSLLVTWEPDRGAGGLGRSASLVSHHLSPLVSLLVTWEPDSDAEGPGNSSILVSNHNNLLSSSPFLHSRHTSPLVCLFVAWEPDGGVGGPGKSRALVSHHNSLVSD